MCFSTRDKLCQFCSLLFKKGRNFAVSSSNLFLDILNFSTQSDSETFPFKLFFTIQINVLSLFHFNPTRLLTYCFFFLISNSFLFYGKEGVKSSNFIVTNSFAFAKLFLAEMRSTCKLNLKQQAKHSAQSSILFYHQLFLKKHSKKIFNKKANLRHFIFQNTINFYVIIHLHFKTLTDSNYYTFLKR